MMKIPLFGKKKLLTSFEFGLQIANISKELKIELTRELVEKAEKTILNELSTRSAYKVNMDIIPILLSILEPKEKSAEK